MPKTNNNIWEVNAYEVENTYNGTVNWTNRYYICPFCREKIIESDYIDKECLYENTLCPLCQGKESNSLWEDAETDDGTEWKSIGE